MADQLSSNICDFLTEQVIPDRGEEEMDNHMTNVENVPPPQQFNQEISVTKPNKITKGFDLKGLTSYLTEDKLKFMAVIVVVFTVMQMSIVRTTIMNLAPLILRSSAMTVNVTISVISTLLIIVAKNMLN